MVRALVLSSAILCLYTSLPCVAQNLVPVIRLSADEATKAKRLVQDLKDAHDRNVKAKVAWGEFRQTYQGAHPELPDVRFTADFRIAFALLNSSLPYVRQAATIELTPQERQKLETLHQDVIESEQSLKNAEMVWQDYKYQLVIDHVGVSSAGSGARVTLGGKEVLIPNPWSSGVAFTTDFKLAFPQVF